MRSWLTLGLGLLALGCATGGALETAVPSAEDPPLDSTPSPSPSQSSLADPDPPPGVETEEPQVLILEECASAARLAEGGEHKLAVDEHSALLEEGVDCGPSTAERIESSRRVLAAADELIRQGLEARDSGDLEGARRRFEEARAVYPKYYWIEALEAELEARFEAAGLSHASGREGAEAIAAGRYDEALRALDAANGLTEYLDSQIAELKDELGGARLAGAQRAQRAGDLELATELVLGVLAIEPVEPVRSRAIEFSRRLGLTRFSSGELERARALWQAALALDSENELLDEYIAEVEARLRSLDAIKKERGE